MKKSNDVFLLTLVDLLLQLLFLGLVLYAVNAARSASGAAQIAQAVKHAKEVARLDSVSQAKGFSTITELTDWLTRLVPADAERLTAVADKVGGVDSVETLVNKALLGSGPTPCIALPGTRIGVPIARIVLWDDSVLVRSIGDSLSRVMRDLGAGTIPAGATSLSDFRRTFGKLRRLDCRYHALRDERTNLVYARDTVAVVFERGR